MKITKKAVAAGTMGAVAASGLGLVLLSAPMASAATTDSSGTSSSTADSGTSTGATSRLQALKDALAGLVTDGSITQDQADKVADTLNTSDALRGGGHGGGRLIDLDTAATTLGLSTDDLRTALQSDGATLATIASDKGVDEQKLIDALVAAAKTRLAEEVTDGDLTQAQADTRIADLPTTVKQAVESTFTGRGGHGGHGGGDSAGTTDGGTTDSGTSSSTDSSSTGSSSSSNTSYTTAATRTSV